MKKLNSSEKVEKDEELLKIPNFINIISRVLTEIIKSNNNISFISNDPFSCKTIPSLNLTYYLERIKKYTYLENSTLTITLIYCDRICQQSKLILYPNNIHRIFLTSSLLAIKYNEDVFYKNDFYAKVGGVGLELLNYLEFCALKFLDFKLFIDEDLFKSYVGFLKNYNYNS